MMNETPWLDAEQQDAWQKVVNLMSALPFTLHRELQSDAGLSLQDYDVMARITDMPGKTARISELGRALHWEKSRLSHHLTRMEKRGHIQRLECADDARGAFVSLTDAGFSALESAAPGHVQLVRKLVFDQLSTAEVASLSAILGKVLRSLDTRGDGGL
ncbi:MAG: MarR family winged helix-turn-helix transcriptional regulator [Arachnia sp.]